MSFNRLFLPYLLGLGWIANALALPFEPAIALPQPAPPVFTSGSLPATQAAVLRAASGADSPAWLTPAFHRLTLQPAAGTATLVDEDLRGGSAVVALDADGDGLTDLAAASRWTSEIHFYRQTAAGFAPRRTVASNLDTAIQLTRARIDADTIDDLVGITDHDRRVFWLQGSAIGPGAAQTLLRAQSPLRAIATGRLNGDAFSDLLLAHGSQILVLTNDTAGGFTLSHAIDFPATSLVLADLNGDGRPDLAARHASSQEIHLLENRQHPAWGPPIPTGWRARDGCFADLDSDGDPDALVAPADGSPLVWAENHGNFAFSAPRPASASRTSVLVCADANADGHPDVWTADPGAPTLSFLAGLAGQPYRRWALDHPLGAASGPDQDADGDGLPNLMSYALGSDPLSHSPPFLLTSDPENPGFSFPWRGPSLPPHGLTHTVETSPDLIHWQPASPQALESTPAEDGWLRFRLRLDLADPSRRYARLKIHYQNP